MDLLVTFSMNRHEISKALMTETLVGTMVQVHRHVGSKTDETYLWKFAVPVAYSGRLPLRRAEVLPVSFLLLREFTSHTLSNGWFMF